MSVKPPSRDAVSDGLEVCGAGAVVAGVAVLLGLGAALVVAGALAILYGFALGRR